MEEAFQLYDREDHQPSSLLRPWPLALLFHDAFKLTGNIGCLDHAIQLYRKLLDMQPEGHIHRCSSLYALGKALRAHSENTGQPEHIEETILIYKEALTLTRVGEHFWYSTCYKLSLSLAALYKHTRQYAHLEEAIRLREQALDLRPMGHPHRPQLCSQLAVLFVTRFRYTGDGLALDRAIVLHREALAILPEAHPYRYASYRALGRSLVARFGQTGTYLVLKEAIENYRQALDLTPKGHPSRYWSCMNLAKSLCILFKVSITAKSPSESPLPEAIELHREALYLHSASQGYKDRSYYSLAESLSLRFSEIGDDAIGREALQFHQKALDLRPKGHRQRNMSCFALARCLRGLFPNDRESKANVMLRLDEALHLSSESDSDDPLCWRILLERAEVSMSLNDHKSAVVDLYNVLSSPQHDIPELLTGSLKLLARANLNHLSLDSQSTLLAAYSSALDLLFVSIGFALDLGSQLQRASDATDAGARAFAISLRVGDLPAGLAVLERARGVIWSQALQVRDPQLDGVPPALQKRLRTILRATSLAHSDEWESEDVEFSLLESETFLSTQDALHQRHTQLQHVISEIRALPGLSDFMRGPNVPALLATASKNPVVMLIANGTECHALVIRSPHEPMVAIRLDISTKALQELILTGSASIRGASTSSESIEDSQRAMRISRRMSASHTTLAKIWRAIVKPVITHLQLVVRDFIFLSNEWNC
jgi:tetratricopeptide (TPR) repeat protein